MSEAGRGDGLTKEQKKQLIERLQQHFEMAEYMSFTLLSHGQSHEFGDYRTRAEAVYDEVFAAASQAVQAFFEEAHRRRGDLRPPPARRSLLPGLRLRRR